LVRLLAAPPGEPTTPITTLVVGAGRAKGFPTVNPGSLALNVDPSALPDIVADIATVNPNSVGVFPNVLYENLNYLDVNQAKLNNTYSLIEPGGKLTIWTGVNASTTRANFNTMLKAAGFVDIQMNYKLDGGFEIQATKPR
jgi:hypothetical protein